MNVHYFNSFSYFCLVRSSIFFSFLVLSRWSWMLRRMYIVVELFKLLHEFKFGFLFGLSWLAILICLWGKPTVTWFAWKDHFKDPFGQSKEIKIFIIKFTKLTFNPFSLFLPLSNVQVIADSAKSSIGFQDLTFFTFNASFNCFIFMLKMRVGPQKVHQDPNLFWLANENKKC